MTLPNLPQTILTDEETMLYAKLSRRFRRRRAIDKAMTWATCCAFPLAGISLVLAVVAVSR